MERKGSLRQSFRHPFHSRSKSTASSIDGSASNSGERKQISSPVLQSQITPVIYCNNSASATPNPCYTPTSPAPSSAPNSINRSSVTDTPRNRSSLLKAPPMNKVWLDDEDDEEDGDSMHDDTIIASSVKNLSGNNSPEKKNSNKRNSQSFFGLKRFGSQRGATANNDKRVDMGAGLHHRSQSTQGFGHKHSSSKISLSSFTSSHSRSRSGIMSFINRDKHQQGDNSSGQKPDISAPTNFVHANHIDADYLKGSSSDKNLIRSESIQSARSNGTGNKPFRPHRPVAGNTTTAHHKHENSMGSLMSTSSKSTRPVSQISFSAHNTPATSASPSPALSSSLHQYQQSQPQPLPQPLPQPQPLPLQHHYYHQVDKKPSIESFGSWAASPNTGDFMEQQKWLLHSMPEAHAALEPTARTTSNAESYNYYSGATSAYACYSPNANASAAMMSISSRRSHASPQPSQPPQKQLQQLQQQQQQQQQQQGGDDRKSVLLPTPNLPITSIPNDSARNYNVPLTASMSSASAAASNLHLTSGQMMHKKDGLGINAHPHQFYNHTNTSPGRRRFLGTVDESNNDFEWF